MEDSITNAELIPERIPSTSFYSAEEVCEEIKKSGYFIVNNFWTAEACTRSCQAIGDFIRENPDKIWKDDQNSDERLFAFDRVNTEAKIFLNDKFINSVFDKLTDGVQRESFVLGARLNFVSSNLGSGGGWHRDSWQNHQYKAILYLSDVDLDHGPFQFVRKSHSWFHRLKLRFLHGMKHDQNRFDSDKDKEIIESMNPITVCGKAGTLLLADTSGIHRGMPILKGQRFAFTIYMSHVGPMPQHLKDLYVK